jgi:hypothetical protein
MPGITLSYNGERVKEIRFKQMDDPEEVVWSKISYTVADTVEVELRGEILRFVMFLKGVKTTEQLFHLIRVEVFMVQY